MDDLELLKAYAADHDQEAFALLVRHHSSWLHAAARRQLGDGHLAEDATQAVFLLLCRRASSLHRHRYLSGWLFLALSYCIRNTKQQCARRERREQEAAMMRPETMETEAKWEEIAPLLDAAVGGLGKADREAVLLRFYEQKPLAEVGRLLGVSEEAARKRVERAVGKLREALAARGVETEAASLAGMVLAHAAEGGVEGLVEKVMAGMGDGVGNGTAGAIAKGAGRMMVMAKVKVATLTLVAVASLAGGVVWVGRSGMIVPLQVMPTAKPDARTMQGTWECVSAVLGGKPDPTKRGMLMVIDGKEVQFVDGGTVFRRTRYQVDASKNPPWMDLLDGGAPGGAPASLGIYSLTGDELRVCAASARRPEQFESAEGSGVQLFVMRRVQSEQRYSVREPGVR